MQIGTTRVFEVLAEHQSESLVAEEERLAQWKTEIQRIVDDNRKADIAQPDALAEHHRTVDEVGVLRREHEERLEAMRTEHEDRLCRMEDELKRARTEATAQMKVRDEEWQHSLNLEKEKTSSQASRARDLAEQLAQADQRPNERYEARLAEVVADKESYANAMTRADSEHARASKLLVVFMVALGLICGVAGWIGGMAVGLGG
jgi:hypothetical protein